MSIPAFGLGTFRLKDEVVKASVSQALDVGYRVIDTAQIYGNEQAIGEAIRASGIPHQDLFLTTKIWTENLSRNKLIPSLKDSLHRLGTEAVDLTLIHWPSPQQQVSVEEYMQALAEAKQQGLTRQIGVSNFTVALMQQAIDAVGREQIATNQIELHPYLQNRTVADFARQQGIHITSYMTLAYGKVLQDPLLLEIARQHQVGTAQVALAWAMQQGYAVIPSSTKRENLISNLQAQQLKLTEKDMQRIASLDRDERLVDPEGLAPQWDEHH